MPTAYQSVEFITREVSFGWYIRSVHKWAATLMIVAVILHQIRVSMEWLGHPVLGDPVYGDVAGRAPRQMLHAARLGFEEIDVEAPDPEDFVALLDGLRG